ncbi:MAG: Membrane family protein [Parcubacteria group bacterium GW2011_GWC1_38_22]|nr:MAG: Membrane family protein [Parcubacteria group bacterium GW2011_GWC1_38_22]
MKKIIEKIKQLQLQQYSLCIILILAAIIRFTGLVRRDLWYDEAFTGVAVKEEFSSMIAMIINDVHPPLYYIFLKGFSFFFDYNVFGIRLFSAIFGLASVWALYILAKELFDAKTARYAALIAAISPLAVQYSQEARMYAMLVFFILIASYFFIKGLKTNKYKYFFWWGIFTGLSMLTHYMGIIFSSLYYPVFIIWNLSDQKMLAIQGVKEKLTILFKKIIPTNQILFGYVTIFLVFLPWLKMFIHHISIKGNNLSWVKPANLGDFAVMIQMFLFGTPLGELSSGMPQPNELSGIAHISIRMVIAMLLGIGIVYLSRRYAKNKIAALLIFSLGFMFVIYSLSATMADQQYFVARYLLPGAFFIFIFIGLWLSQLKWQIVTGIFGIYIFLISLIVPLSNSKGYNEMISHLDKYRNSNFYILNSFDYVIAKYYLGDEKLTLYNYDWPGYNPDFWAAIGKDLKRTENFDNLKNDPKALIISNKPLTRDNQYFSTKDLVLVDQYKNILVYKFQR